MRVIDADKLFKDIKNIDLEYMQQADIIECLKDVIDRQPTIPQKVEIENVALFDNRKNI